MRSLRSEVVFLTLALAMPAVVFSVLPYSALRFRARDVPERPEAFAAFVSLDDMQEQRAMRRAKSAWRNAGPDVTINPSDLIFEVLPDEAPAPLVRIEDRAKAAPPERVPFRPSSYFPTCAAPAAAPIPVEPETAAKTFPLDPEEEMLKLAR